jgi:hypothetical protein
MLKTLLASSSLSLVLLLTPILSYGPIDASGISGPSLAMAHTKKPKAGIEVDLGDDDDDDEDDCEDWEDDCDDDDDD